MGRDIDRIAHPDYSAGENDPVIPKQQRGATFGLWDQQSNREPYERLAKPHWEWRAEAAISNHNAEGAP